MQLEIEIKALHPYTPIFILFYFILLYFTSVYFCFCFVVVVAAVFCTNKNGAKMIKKKHKASKQERTTEKNTHTPLHTHTDKHLSNPITYAFRSHLIIKNKNILT